MYVLAPKGQLRASLAPRTAIEHVFNSCEGILEYVLPPRGHSRTCFVSLKNTLVPVLAPERELKYMWAPKRAFLYGILLLGGHLNTFKAPI